jgi:hypothetical protein
MKYYYNIFFILNTIEKIYSISKYSKGAIMEMILSQTTKMTSLFDRYMDKLERRLLKISNAIF